MSDLEPRRVTEATEITYTGTDGLQHTLRSKTADGDDSYHYVEPQSAEDVEALVGLGYPVARKVMGEAEDDEPAKPTRGRK